MKYKFVVRKERQKGDDDIFRGRMYDQGYDDVFDVEITAEEMIEMMQFLWQLSVKRNSTPETN